jgi:hypothetical protein
LVSVADDVTVFVAVALVVTVTVTDCVRVLVTVGVAVTVLVLVNVGVLVPVRVGVPDTVADIDADVLREGERVVDGVVELLIEGVDDADFVSMYSTYTGARTLPLNRGSSAEDATFEIVYA